MTASRKQSVQEAGLAGSGIAAEEIGGARRDRTADLLHAMQALSQLSYGPKCRIKCRIRGNSPYHTSGAALSLVFLLDAFADDVGDVVAAFFFFDERGVVQGFVVFDFDIVGIGHFIALGGDFRLALRLGVGGPPLNKGGAFLFRVLFLGFAGGPAAGGRWWGGRCGGLAGGIGSRPADRHHDFEHRAALRADDRILAQIVKFRAAGTAKALGAKLWLCHG